MEMLYDEERAREVPQTWKREDGDHDGIDMLYLRVRLLKTVAEVKSNGGLGVERWPIYFLLEERKSFEGDPADHRESRKRTRVRTYTTGPDSKRIRQAVALADSLEGKRAYDSR